MIEELHIKNFALIDRADLEFENGFTVLSGETGAGKSILIGSLAFLLGGKGGIEQIRTGCHEAEVSGIFLIENKEGLEWLTEHGMEAEDNRILLRRLMRDTGKSSAWIGSTPVTRADLASFAAFLVDLHGQHEQQSLMKVTEHRRYLDIYADIVDEVKNFTGIYNQLIDKRKILDSLNTNEDQRAERIEMLEFQINEIQAAKLLPNEDENLEEEETRLTSYEKLFEDLENLSSLFEGTEDSGGIIQLLKKANSILPHASEMDKVLSPLEDRLQSAFYEIDDISEELSRYKNSLTYDPARLAEVQERLDLIYKLKKKYASSQNGALSEINEYLERAEKELESLSGAGQDKSALENEIKILEKEVYEKAKKISGQRKTASDKMSAEIEAILSQLGMKDTRFRVNLQEKPGNEVSQKCGPYGMDDIEFLISANPGSPLLPLSKIASGGELSRVMLAMKTILSNGDTVSTLIFDEIDTGIGGEIALSLGKHMKALAQKKQILCITHLASIASFAHNQIKIQKGSDGESTQTKVFPIEGEARIAEIARMLSGDAQSKESLEHAARLLQTNAGVN